MSFFSASVLDRGPPLEGTDRPGPCPLCSSQCQGTKLICSQAEKCSLHACNAQDECYHSCPPGCSSKYSDLCAASQAGGEDSCSAHWERQHQHWRERSAALSSWWVLPLDCCLCLGITNSCGRFPLFFELHFCPIFFSGIDLIAAFYGCLYAGCVPVNVRPPHPQNLAATLPTVRMIIDVSMCFLLHMDMHYGRLMDLCWHMYVHSFNHNISQYWSFLLWPIIRCCN